MKKIGIEIFGRIWFIWFMIVFFFIIVLCYPLMLFISKKHTVRNVARISFVYRICTSFFCGLGGFRIRITGKQNYNENEKYIIVANHRSLMDIPIFVTYFKSRIIAKKSFFTKVPFFSIYYKKGTILVDRKSRNSRSQSFEEMKKVLSQNISMAIYPEGTRNRGNESLLPFHNGAFKLAKETGASILPVVLCNTDQAISPKKLFFAMPTVMKIHILPAISPNNFPTMEELRDNVKECIKIDYEKMKNQNFDNKKL